MGKTLVPATFLTLWYTGLMTAMCKGQITWEVRPSGTVSSMWGDNEAVDEGAAGSCALVWEAPVL